MTEKQDQRTAKTTCSDLISRIAILLIAVLASQPAPASEQGLPPLEGVWFTCEFATSQSPPDDGCAMFDDEGTQKFDLQTSPDYVSVIPAKDKCIWTRKRHFYVAPYKGKLDRK